MRGKYLKTLLLLAITTTVGAACSDSKTDTSKGESAATEKQSVKEPKIDKPTELTLYHPWGMTLQLFMDTEGKHIVKKYPNLSFKVLNASNGTLEQLIASGTKIDLIYATENQLDVVQDTRLDSDLSDLIKLYSYDFQKLEPSVANYIQKLNGGKVPAMPTQLQTLALFYNKSLFDKFGVPYLTDSLTWDQLYDISRKLTRVDGGVIYRGYGDRVYSNAFRFNPFSLALVDNTSYKAIFETDRMKEYMNQLIRPLKLPEYAVTKDIINNANDLFMKEQTLAIITKMSTDFPRASTGDTINWDAAAYPTFKENPGVGPQPEIIMWYVTANSQNREAAFIAAAEMSSSRVQMELFKDGSMSVLKDKSGFGTFGSNLPDLKGKNANALVPKKFAEKSPYNRYASTAISQLNKVYVDLALDAKDINTAFREAVETANKNIEQKLQK